MPEKNIDPVKLERVKSLLESKPGFNYNLAKSNFKASMGHVSPMTPTGLEDKFTPDSFEYDQGILTDSMSAVWNSLVIGGGEALGNLVPNIAHVAGADNEFLDKWKGNVTNWFDAQKTIYSDNANKEINGFDDINAEHVATGLGQGVGFILGIMGGAGWGKAAGSIIKGGEAFSTASKSAQGIAKMEKYLNNSARVGSFLTGTAMMYTDVEKEALRAGLDKNSAARFALGISGIVSLTEGAALEWVGKAMSRPVTSTMARASVRETLATAGTENPLQLQNLFLQNFGKRLGVKGAAAFESAAVEGTQEFVQTYIEEGAKKLYDVTLGKNSEVGKGKFGADIDIRTDKGYKTFVEATFGGIIGGIIGGAMGGGGSFLKGNELAKESMFGYVNNAVQQKKPENIAKLVSSIDEMVANKKMTEKQGEAAKKNISDLQSFATDINTTDIKSGVAHYQLFQLDKLSKGVQSVNDSVVINNESNPSLKKFSEEKKGKIGLVSERVQEHFNSIFDSKKPETKKKDVFEKKLAKYVALVSDIHKNNIDEVEVKERLDKIFSTEKKAEKTEGVDTATATAKAAESTFGKTYEHEGVQYTEKALNSIDKINEAALDMKGTKEEFMQDMEKEYGIKPEAVSKIMNEPIGKAFQEGKMKEVKESAFDKFAKAVVDKNAPIENEVTRKTKAINETIKAQLKKEFPGYDFSESIDKYGRAIQSDEDLVTTIDDTGKKVPSKIASRIDDIVHDVNNGKPIREAVKENKEEYEARKEARSIRRFADKIIAGEDVSSPENKQFYENNKEGIEKELLSRKEQSEQNKEEEIDSKKSDVEKRRQEELDSIISEAVLDDTGYKSTKGFKITGWSKTEVEGKINAKYDAELAALEASVNNGSVENNEDAQETESNVEENNGDEIDEDFVDREPTQSFDDFLDSFDSDEQGDITDAMNEDSPKEQRLFSSSAADVIASNPELFNKILNHFKKIFPNVSVEMVDKIVSKYGADVLGQVSKNGVKIVRDKALQTTVIHEFAHIYFELLGKNHPLIRLGKQLVAGSKYHEEAKRLYPNLSADGQLEEALIEALSERALEKLQAKFEGNAWQKFLEFAKRFWNATKNLFTRAKSGDAIDALSNSLINSAPIKVDLGFMKGMVRDQVYQDPRFFTSTQLVQNTLARLKVKIVLEKIKPVWDVNLIKYQVYEAFLDRYNAEKEGKAPAGDVHIFEGIGIEPFMNTSIAEDKAKISAVRKALIAFNPNLNALIEKTVENIAKVAMPKEDLETDDSIKQKENNKVKSDKRVSASVRSLISTLVDENGNVMSSSEIDRYITSVASNTLTSKDFLERIKNDALNNRSFVAKRLNGLMSTLDEGVVRSMTSELSSLMQEVSNKILMNKDAESEKESIRIKQVNQDYSTTETIERKANRIESFNDTPEMWTGLFNMKLADFLNTRYNEKEIDKLNSKSPEAKKMFRDILERIMGENITQEVSDRYMDLYRPSFALAMFSNLMNGRKKKDGKKYTKKDLSGLIKAFVELQDQVEYVSARYINSKGNSVSSTKFGYWMSQLNSLMTFDSKYRRRMAKSPLYENNTFLKYSFKTFGKIKWAIHDAIDNDIVKKISEYTGQVASDLKLSAFIHFANDSSKGDYWQVYGINADRTHSTYFKVPRIKMDSTTAKYGNIAAEYENLAKAERYAMTEKVASMEKGSDEWNKFVSDFNKMSINFMDVKTGNIYTPFDSNYSSEKTKSKNKAISELTSLIDKYNLSDKISADHVKSGGLYSTVAEMAEAFYYNEALNRQHLTNVYQGPMVHRKSVSDNIKRAGGNNSGGQRVELDKPVITIVIDAPSTKLAKVFTSDSFSFNGSKLHGHINNYFGDLYNVGTNMKDMLYQVNPDNGKMLFLKMSTFNVIGQKGESNMHEMNEHYAAIADALFDIEKHVGDRAYVKIVDSKSLKGNEGDYKAVNVYKFSEMIKNGQVQEVIDNHAFETEFFNYVVPFNLNKPLSKVPLSKQSTVLSTQLMKIALNLGNPSAVTEFESMIKSLLEKNLGIKTDGDLNTSEIINNLFKNKELLTAVLNNMDDLQQNSLSKVITDVMNYNKSRKGAERIKAMDHPNLIRVIQQFISTKLFKSGIRVEAAGNYLQMVPDYGNKLKWYRDVDGKFEPAEVAVPWSMFGSSIEAANELLANSPDGLKVVLVRVPASAEVSTFVAKVKYFTEGDTNASILPDEFVKMSDADHDGDKVFVYREELMSDKEGNTIVVQSKKTDIFNQLYKNISSETIRQGTKNDLSTDEIKKFVADNEFNEEDGYKIDDFSNLSNVASKMSFGGDAIGILAVVGKMLSMLSQSQESLTTPLEFNGKELTEFKKDSLIDAAKFLQAALDMGNDPVLLSTGMNRHTINVGSTLIMLGVHYQEVIRFLKDETITKFVEKLDDEVSTFNVEKKLSAANVLRKYMIELSGVEALENFKDVDSINAVINSNTAKFGFAGIAGNYAEGVTYTTRKKDVAFTLKKNVERSKNSNYDSYDVEFVEAPESDAYTTIKKFVEIAAISADIQKLVPVIQMDKQLPSNGEEVRELLKTLSEIEKNDLKITTKSMVERPLIKHYIEMLKIQEGINKKHFVTEGDNFISFVKGLAPSLKTDDAHSDVAAMFAKYVAQKNLSGNNPNAADFIESFGSKVMNMINAVNGKEVAPENEDYADTVKQLLEQKANNPELYAKNAAAEPALAAMADRYEQALDEAIDMKNTYANNTFLKYIEISNKEGINIVRANNEYRKLTDSVKQKIREDFNSLPAKMRADFYDYQLYRYGISEVLGSMIDMMPSEHAIDYLKSMNTFRKKAISESVEYNMVFAMKDELKQLPMKKGKPDATNGYFKIGDQIVRVQSGVVMKLNSNEFQSSKYFTKFDDNITHEVVPLDKVNELKKSCGI